MARVNLGQMYAEVAGRTALWDRPSTCVSLALQACEPPCVCHMLISELDTWCGRRLPAGRSGTRSSHETGCNGQGLRQNAEGSSLSLRQRPMMIYESTMPILIHYDLLTNVENLGTIWPTLACACAQATGCLLDDSHVLKPNSWRFPCWQTECQMFACWNSFLFGSVLTE